MARRMRGVVYASPGVAACLALAFASGPGCGSDTQQEQGDGGGDARGASRDAGAPRDARSVRETGAADRSVRDVAHDVGQGPPVDAGPCGTRTGMRGLTHRKMTVAGLARTYIIYLPAGLDPKTPIPFVFVHHGYTMTDDEMVAITHYTNLADSEGIGVAFPQGENGSNPLGAPWNVGKDVCPSVLGPPPEATGDDLAFLDAMEADVSEDQCLDASHVFLTGFSMGGYFAHQVGCMRPDIRAVAPHSGGTHDLSSCASKHKPILIFHGDADPVIPYGCDVPDASNTPPGFTPSAIEWANKNGCGATTTSTAVENGTCYYFDACPSDGQVAYCVFNGMGHCWAGGSAEGGIYSCPGYESATQLEWNFFKKYAW